MPLTVRYFDEGVFVLCNTALLFKYKKEAEQNGSLYFYMKSYMRVNNYPARANNFSIVDTASLCCGWFLFKYLSMNCESPLSELSLSAA